ncbi:FAD/NAD(P)-binding domain-containing protein [Clavulina sp. PMI_390]|nr:FAD/NAD(P)-binding domain-containing protein [Clavulina sp. PMI_390]
MHPSKICTLSLCVTTVFGLQRPLKPGSYQDSEDIYYRLPNDIRRVAVIGAGPAGLQFTSTLIKHGFEVRMFERAPNPGGIWQYTDKVPIPVTFPPIDTMAYVPDIPETLPATHVYEDGEEGLTVEWRIREHWAPSPVWKNMTTTTPSKWMTLPDTNYPKNTPWKHTQMDVSRHVRQYASSVGLNANDEEHANVTAYWTRVERVEKVAGSQKRWTLTLRKLTPVRDGKLEVHWWQEEFDAVVVGNDTDNDAAWVPTIPGLDDWARVVPDAVFHSRQYRRPQPFANKNVLIVGGGYSGVGIANDLIGFARSVTVSTRERFDNGPSPKPVNLKNALITLANGTVVSDFDIIILATGHRRSLPYLVGFHNSTIQGRDEPDTIKAPVITDGTHLRSLHWTGHYIDDPTLLFCTDLPWGGGLVGYQALGAARVWAGKARLPSITRMWKMYPGAANLLRDVPVTGQVRVRLFVTWLNTEILEFGGSFVAPPPVDETLELLRYYVAKQYPPAITHFYDSAPSGDLPRRDWDVYTGEHEVQPRSLSHQQLKALYGDQPSGHWAELSLRW